MQRVVVAVAGAALVTATAAAAFVKVRHLIRQYYHRRNRERYTYKVYFFPLDKMPCQATFFSGEGCFRPKCPMTHEPNVFNEFMALLDGARRSLDVCIHLCTIDDIAEVLVTKHEAGVRVRVICDDEMSTTDASRTGKLRAAGVLVRSNRRGYLMHHKFAVVDGQWLMTGSLNWTQQAIMGNTENVVVTDNPALVRPYAKEFARLWAKFDPIAKHRDL